MLVQMVYTKQFSIQLYKSYSFIFCKNKYTFPSFSKQYPREKWVFLCKSLFIMEIVNCFGKKPVQVEKCIIAISKENLETQ